MTPVIEYYDLTTFFEIMERERERERERGGGRDGLSFRRFFIHGPLGNSIFLNIFLQSKEKLVTNTVT